MVFPEVWRHLIMYYTGTLLVILPIFWNGRFVATVFAFY